MLSRTSHNTVSLLVKSGISWVLKVRCINLGSWSSCSTGDDLGVAHGEWLFVWWGFDGWSNLFIIWFVHLLSAICVIVQTKHCVTCYYFPYMVYLSFDVFLAITLCLFVIVLCLICGFVWPALSSFVFPTSILFCLKSWDNSRVCNCCWSHWNFLRYCLSTADFVTFLVCHFCILSVMFRVWCHFGRL